MNDLILLHGALGDARQLAPLADRLGTTRRVTVIEMPGHGITPADGSFRIEGFAEAVLGRMTREEISSADFFGYSMGGYVALYLAATAPDRVRRVETLATKLAWTPEGAERETAMLDAAAIRAKVPKFAAALEARHTALGWEELLSRTAELMRDLGARPVVDAELLGRIAQPARLGVGDRDATVSIDESLAAVRQLPNGELEVHPRTAHPFEKVSIDRIARSLTDFFASG